jgi:fibronectin type III domain protein
VTSYHDVSLPSGTPYSYRVRSYGSGGNSGYTNTADATTQTPPSVPAAPSNLVATASTTVSSVVHLTWTDNSTNETDFVVEESANNGPFVALTPNVPANNSAADVGGRTGATGYTYRIRAHNGAGYSSYSNTSSTTTLPSQIVIIPSADNVLTYAVVNGNVTNDGNVVTQAGENGVGCNAISGYTSAFYCLETAFQFNTFASTISGRTIVSATLRLSPSSLAGDFNTVHAVNAFASGWSPTTITWNNQPQYYLAGQSNHAAPTVGVPVDFDVTAIAQAWANGSWANNGILLRDLTGPAPSAVRVTGFWSVDYYNDAAFRPQLIITVQ